MSAWKVQERFATIGSSKIVYEVIPPHGYEPTDTFESRDIAEAVVNYRNKRQAARRTSVAEAVVKIFNREDSHAT